MNRSQSAFLGNFVLTKERIQCFVIPLMLKMQLNSGILKDYWTQLIPFLHCQIIAEAQSGFVVMLLSASPWPSTKHKASLFRVCLASICRLNAFLTVSCMSHYSEQRIRKTYECARKARKNCENVVYPEVFSTKFKSRARILQRSHIPNKKFVITSLKNSKMLLPTTQPKSRISFQT